MRDGKKRLAIVTSHPIQYNAPFFQLLAAGTDIHPGVFYTWEQSAQGPKYDPDFKEKIEWDIPLLEGYEYRFVRNQASDPGTHHFRGLVNPSLNSELAAWKPDAILVYGWSFDSHLKCLRHFHGKIPLLFRGDSTLLDEQPGIRKHLRRWFLKWVYGHVDFALYAGKHNKEYFLAHGLRNDQLIYAPHAIDNSRFGEPDAQYKQLAAAWRDRLEIGATDLVLLFAGKLEPKKNPFFLLEIGRLVPDPRLKIVFVGTGELEESLRQASAGDKRIRFLGFRNQREMPVVYRLGDIYMLPSLGPGETWGLGVNEAMASGCAIMMSDRAGGSADLVETGINGIRFDPANDLETCCDLVNRLLGDPALLEQYKNESRRLIGSFSYRQLVDSLSPDLF